MSHARRALLPLSIALALVIVNLAPSSAQNLIVDGGFENGFVVDCGQARLPADWIFNTSSPDVFSFDCSTRPGLNPNTFSNFTTISSAQAGLRFVGGGTAAGIESFGQLLPTPLTPGFRYRLSAYFSNMDRLPEPGHFAIHLMGAPGTPTESPVGMIGANSSTGVWTYDAIEFCAPSDADTRPYIIMWPESNASSSYYCGTDEWVLEVIDTCEPISTVDQSWSALKANFE